MAAYLALMLPRLRWYAALAVNAYVIESDRLDHDIVYMRSGAVLSFPVTGLHVIAHYWQITVGPTNTVTYYLIATLCTAGSLLTLVRALWGPVSCNACFYTNLA